ncbi:MAG: DUF362 domain-containing protein [Bacteroidales bacterium]
MKKDLAKKAWAMAVGFAALVWFVIRVIPDPRRAAYPCQRAAFPLASAFVIWITGLISSVTWIRKFRRSKPILPWFQAACFTLLLVLFTIHSWMAEAGQIWGVTTGGGNFIPAEGSNKPMGSGTGIHPGRVTWVHHPEMVLFRGTGGHFWEPEMADQQGLDTVFMHSLCMLTGERTDRAAWAALFAHFKDNHGKDPAGYLPGEKIAVKINMNTAGSHGDRDDGTNTSPHVAMALATQLVERAGVPDSCITFYDISRPVPDYITEAIWSNYPGIRFVDAVGGNGRVRYETDLSAGVQWSRELTLEQGGGHPTYLPGTVSEADYLINLGNMKGHDLAGVTICAKNHVGSIISRNPDNEKLSSPRAAGIHPYIAVHDFDYWDLPMRDTATYNTLVDLMGHRDLGGKTLLFIIDGLFAVKTQHGNVDQNQVWSSAPFNGNFTSSILMSIDGVAIESVGLDFLRSEPSMTQVYGNVDNYLHEAALAHAPPSGVFYDPEQDGTGTGSLGVHEHWNNAIERKYSRNLGKEKGIELVSFREGDHLPDRPEKLQASLAEGSRIRISWRDRSDNEICFVLERWESGQADFSVLTEIPADRVCFVDSAICQGPEIRYRIKAVGIHGESAYSEPVSVFFTRVPDAGRKADLILYPNPSHGMVTLSYSPAGSGKVAIILYDLSGRVVHEQTTPSVAGKLNTRIDLGNHPAGTYLLEVREGAKRIHKKLILK